MRCHISSNARFHPIRRGLSLVVSVVCLASNLLPQGAWGSGSHHPVSETTRTIPPPNHHEASLTLDPSHLSIPENLRHLVEVYRPEPALQATGQREAVGVSAGVSPQRLIIHLQDLHTHPQAQRAIAELIEVLHATTGVSLVALEGGGLGLLKRNCSPRFPIQISPPPSHTIFSRRASLQGRSSTR